MAGGGSLLGPAGRHIAPCRRWRRYARWWRPLCLRCRRRPLCLRCSRRSVRGPGRRLALPASPALRARLCAQSVQRGSPARRQAGAPAVGQVVAQVALGGEHGAAARARRLSAVHSRVVRQVGRVAEHLVAQPAGERALLTAARRHARHELQQTWRRTGRENG